MFWVAKDLSCAQRLVTVTIMDQLRPIVGVVNHVGVRVESLSWNVYEGKLGKMWVVTYIRSQGRKLALFAHIRKP